MIVGPPYAIERCAPIIGPVDGGTELIITGMGFTNDPCVVRFSFGKGEDQFADADGEYISPTEIKVVTPVRPNVAWPVRLDCSPEKAEFVPRRTLKNLARRRLTCGFR